MDFTLHTVFTAVECGRLLEVAHLKGKKKALDTELLFRVAAGRVSRACGEWPSDRELDKAYVDLSTLERQNDTWRITSVWDADLHYYWYPELRSVGMGTAYEVLELEAI